MSASSFRQLDHVRDRRIEWATGLVAPALVLGEQPLTDAAEEVVVRGRSAVADILNRSEDRLMVVVGQPSGGGSAVTE